MSAVRQIDRETELMGERLSWEERKRLEEQERIRRQRDRKTREAANKEALLETKREERRTASSRSKDIQRRRTETKLKPYYDLAERMQQQNG